MKDLESRDDIAKMVNTFYEKVKADSLISYLFTDVAQVNWEHHLPVMYDFWESIVFGKGDYKGNPMQSHIQLHGKSPLKAEHFSRWLELFQSNLKEHFSGPNTEIASQRAQSIAMMIQLKTSGY